MPKAQVFDKTAIFSPARLINCRLDELSNHPKILRSLIDDHLFLNTSYHILISTLHRLYAAQTPSQELITLVLHTRELAMTLGYLFENYLHVPREALRLKTHADILYDWLTQNTNIPTNQLTRASSQFQKADTVTRKIHGIFVDYNQPRLLVTRLKRLLSALSPFLQGIYPRIISPIEKIANPALNYVAWIFFLPRFATNSMLLLKHLVAGWWMSETEQSLPSSLRIKTAFKRHWAELCNDSVWCASGFLGCFFLIGNAAPIASYVVGILYWYDVLISAINAAVELNRLTRLRDYYVTNNYPAEVQQQLSKQIAYEQRRFTLSITANTLLAITIILTLPFLATNPLFPLIGACLLLAFTIISYGLSLKNKKTNPDTYSSPLINHGIFQARPAQAAPALEPDGIEMIMLPSTATI